MSADTYRQFAAYYDAYVGDFAQDLPLYLALCPTGQRILEVGCGTGRVLKAFLERDDCIDGVDISLDMLAAAHHKLADYLREGSLRLSNHDFREAALPETYDRILVSFYTFNYLLEDADRVRFLRNLFKSLKDRGLVILDLFYPRALAQPEQAGVWRERGLSLAGQPVRVRDKRIMLDETVEERTQQYIWPDRREKITTCRRYIGKREIAAILEKAGFFHVLCTDGYDGAGFHEPQAGELTGDHFVVRAEK